jgi:hypothetical protein
MRRFLAALFLTSLAIAQQREGTPYDNLAAGQVIAGFRTTAVYTDDDNHPIGARFLHMRSGFTLDLLRIQSAPQAFIWVTTFPTSNMGEPHTLEHLLMGKGNKGRAIESQERMSLVDSSAFTEQWRTCYHFYTAAGPDIFFQQLSRRMDGLLHPDYTNEEVRREVRNFGISEDANDRSLHLEEKGTVYNEMVTTMDRARWRLPGAYQRALYGPTHPLALDSGGLPADLRVIRPEDIRRFHDQHYFLANMGAIAALPKDVGLAGALAQFDTLLERLEPDSSARRPAILTEDQLPAPQPAPAGQIGYVDYPMQNEREPSDAAMFWPADLKLTLHGRNILELFLSNVAGDVDTNLYHRLIDSNTREADFGLRGVSATVDRDQGNPVMVKLLGVPVARINDRDLGELRAKVVDEFTRIAAYADGSPELAQFNRRLKGRIVEKRRALAKMVNSPPLFGVRSTGPIWLDTLYDLDREPGFRKTITMKDDLAAIETMVAGSHNVWRDYLAQWKLLGVLPSVQAAKPNAALIHQADEERAARAAAETERLRQQYGAADGQEALRKYRVEYDAATAVIDQADRNAPGPKFLEHPPMTLDGALEFKTTELAGGIPLVSSTFENMTGATVGIALRLDGVPEDRLMYLSLLPELLINNGVVEHGKPISYDGMAQRLRDEILSLDAYFSRNISTGRYELVLRGAGGNATESIRAIEWMELALYHPNWRMENLSGIRDDVDQELGELRRVMPQYAEESWVSEPADAYWKQDNPLMLSTISFLTETHNVQRLRWMLKEGGSDAVCAFLASLGEAQGSRQDRKARLAAILSGKAPEMEKLSTKERDLAMEAARDLEAVLTDIPDASLAADWSYLCGEMAHDLRQGPERTLAILNEVRRSLLVTGGARMFVIGSAAMQAQLGAGIRELTAGLGTAPMKKAVYRAGKRIDQRLLSREPGTTPVFVSLLNPNSQRGVLLNSAPMAGYRDTGRDKLLDYLAVNVYSGGGAHSVHNKTISAGLAYSNGIRPSLATSRVNYYVERAADLTQTLKFVIGVLRAPAPDIPLTDYALAGAFQNTRVQDTYEVRGERMAEDLADGLKPEVIARFRQAILDVCKSTPDLQAELLRRVATVDAQVLPGMGPKGKDVAGAVYFAIGPEKQLALYEGYLKSTDGPDAQVRRLYPRDFWMTIP